MILIIDLDSNYNLNNIQDDTLILTTNNHFKNNNKNVINVDFSLVDNSNKPSDCINDFFDNQSKNFSPFRNDFYMRVFRPIFAVIYQIEAICSEFKIKKIVLNSGADFPFVTLFHGMGEGKPKFFKNSWLINYFIKCYFNKLICIEWQNKKNKVLFLLFYFGRELIFTFLRLTKKIIKVLLYTNKSNFSLSNYKYFVFAQLPLQIVHLKQTLSFVDKNKLLFLTKTDIKFDSKIFNTSYIPKFADLVDSIKQLHEDVILNRNKNTKFKFYDTKIKLSQIYIVLPLLYQYINFYSDLFFLKTNFLKETFKSKPILISNMTFGSDITFIKKLSEEIGGSHFNYQSVNMSVMSYPQIRLADFFYLYNNFSYDFYKKLDSSYRYYLPIYNDIDNFFLNDKDLLKITIFTQPDVFTELYIDFIKKLNILITENNLPIEIIVKLHYRQDKVDLFTDLISTYANFTLADSNISLVELFSNSNFIMSMTSAVLFEAFQYNCPAVIVDLNKMNTKYIEINCLTQVNFVVNDFSKLIEILKNPHKYHVLYKERRKKFIKVDCECKYKNDLLLNSF